MELSSEKLHIVLTLTYGLGLATVLGYLTEKIRLSPLLGYLVAGYLIGPYSPGFVADVTIAEQLAEMGIILMMLSVGLHFRLEDLIKVKNIAIPGAIGQTAISAVAGAFFLHWMGWSWEAGIIVGLAIGVASTVVLIRVLTDYKLIQSPQGHIAIGWLIVEDILTVIVLLVLPILSTSLVSMESLAWALGEAAFKFLLLAAVMFTAGSWLVKKVLILVARTRSHELFTLTILALTCLISVGSAYLFGASIALGAFIAGMIIGGTDVRHQASANALPIKDAFVVLFFLSVGMLFDPHTISKHLTAFLAILAIILLIKPLVAFLIMKLFRYPLKTTLVVSLALAQIGEFSFILAEEGTKLNILPDDGFDIIVACALISIALNPLLFGWLSKFSYSHRKHEKFEPILPHKKTDAVIIGYGPMGQMASRILETLGLSSVIIDRNIDSIQRIKKIGLQTIFGDAAQSNILESAFIESASLLVITVPEIEATEAIILLAKRLNPSIQIIARVQYQSEKHLFSHLGIQTICSEEETSKALQALIEETVSPLKLKI